MKNHREFDAGGFNQPNDRRILRLDATLEEKQQAYSDALVRAKSIVDTSLIRVLDETLATTKLQADEFLASVFSAKEAFGQAIIAKRNLPWEDGIYPGQNCYLATYTSKPLDSKDLNLRMLITSVGTSPEAAVTAIGLIIDDVKKSNPFERFGLELSWERVLPTPLYSIRKRA